MSGRGGLGSAGVGGAPGPLQEWWPPAGAHAELCADPQQSRVGGIKAILKLN